MTQYSKRLSVCVNDSTLKTLVTQNVYVCV